jgi:hypothetical protein
MIYLTQTSSEQVRAKITERPDLLGQLCAPGGGSPPLEGARWGADNGAFTGRYPGDDGFLDWLARYEGARDRCLFATAPDVVGDHEATLKRSRPMLERLRKAGWPAGFVAQDGMEWSSVDLWDEMDALFIGGSTEWKLGAEAANLVAVAASLGKHVHMGRVNSGKRWRYAQWIGCDSADGTFIARAPDTNLPRLLRWVDDPQMQLEGLAP